MAEVVSRQRKPALTKKQAKFVDAYVETGVGTQAARAAGYSDANGNTLAASASRTLRSLRVVNAVAAQGFEITRPGVQLRLHELSLDAQSCGQFGPAVRAEELLGKSIGMWIDQQLSVVVGDSAVAALIDLARRRQTEPVDLEDDQHTHEHTRLIDEDC